MSANKFEIEKALHEVIRDLPDAARYAEMFRRGQAPLQDCLSAIAATIRAEKAKANR